MDCDLEHWRTKEVIYGLETIVKQAVTAKYEEGIGNEVITLYSGVSASTIKRIESYTCTNFVQILKYADVIFRIVGEPAQRARRKRRA